MIVKFIVQVLSELAAKYHQTFGTTEASETAKCCQLLDHFFNCLNVRTLAGHQKKTKPFLKPYTDENDDENEKFLVDDRSVPSIS